LVNGAAEILARLCAGAGRRLGALAGGRVSLYLAGYAAGVAALVVYFAAAFF
jgi:hypothetical protein